MLVFILSFFIGCTILGPSLVVNAKTILNEAPPEIKIALEGSSDWDYDILELERITEKR